MIYKDSVINYIIQNYPLAETGNIIVGKIFRFDIDKKDNGAGWAILFEDGNGIVGDWRTGEQILCFPTTVNSVDREEFKKKVCRILDSVHIEALPRLASTYQNLPDVADYYSTDFK